MGPVLEARGVRKSYGDVEALKGADLEVAAGSIVSLLGRNGAGKSTLLSIVAGLVAADAGTVVVDGIDAATSPDDVASRIGIAPQETGIYPVLTVLENLMFFSDLAGVPRADRRTRSVEVAEQLGLGPLLERKGNQLSGGEARRLHTACALVHRPKLLMLDEPTVGADVETRNQLIEAVRGLAADGAAVVYTTHYLPEVEALDAQIVIIDEGRILARGRRSELIEAHHLGGLRFTVRGDVADHRLAGLDIASTRRLDQGALTEFLAVGGVTMADLLARFDGEADRLLSVERNQPDLESVFLAVTGAELGADAGGLGGAPADLPGGGAGR